MDYIYVYISTHPQAGQIVTGPVETDPEGFPRNGKIIVGDKGKPAEIVRRCQRILGLGEEAPEFSRRIARNILEYYGRAGQTGQKQGEPG